MCTLANCCLHESDLLGRPDDCRSPGPVGCVSAPTWDNSWRAAGEYAGSRVGLQSIGKAVGTNQALILGRLDAARSSPASPVEFLDPSPADSAEVGIHKSSDYLWLCALRTRGNGRLPSSRGRFAVNPCVTRCSARYAVRLRPNEGPLQHEVHDRAGSELARGGASPAGATS